MSDEGRSIPVSQQRARIARLVRDRTTTQGHNLQPSDVDRFAATLAMLPPPPGSILDAGCGTGVLADVALELGYQATGLDTDPAVMAHMTAPAKVGSIAAIPLDDRSVDLAVANEVLEHLPVDVYPAAVTELARVATRAVIVSVPNAESLEAASTQCPMCRATYSIHGHVRRFERRDMPHLIPGFTMDALEKVGPYKLRHRSIEWVIRRRMLGRWPSQPGAVCPQCGFRQGGVSAGARQPSRRGAVVRLVAGAPWRRWWFVARYVRAPHDSG